MQIIQSVPNEAWFASTEVAKGYEMEEMLKSGEISKDGRVDAQSTLRDYTTISMPSMLKYAASTYKISRHPEDYVLIPIPAIIADVPNRNGVAFSSRGLAEFSPLLGMPYFKSWTGKPTFDEHQSSQMDAAKGIIIDSIMNTVRNRPGFYKTTFLASYDRSKDPNIYDDIVSGRSRAYSIGAHVLTYKCSICDAESDTRNVRCPHIGSSKIVLYESPDGRLAYREAWNPIGTEISRVKSPAYITAVADILAQIEKL